MSSCCSTEKRTTAQCPVCNQKAKSVGRITLEHLLIDEIIPTLQDTTYYFCATLTCDVVYFSAEHAQIYKKADVRVRVGLKETLDPIPVCYCFDYTEQMIAEEINRTGTTLIPERIRQEVQADTCECETKNPQGTCCLGNVGRAVKKAKAQKGQEVS